MSDQKLDNKTNNETQDNSYTAPKQKPKKKKVPLDIAKEHIIDSIVGGAWQNRIGDFHEVWRVFTDQNDTRHLLKLEKDNSYSFLTPEKAIRELDIFTARLKELNVGYCMTTAALKDIYRKCKNRAKNIPEPEPIAFLNENKSCFVRLPFEKDQDGDTSVFDELFSRMNNPLPIKIFLGSLAFPKADRSQVVCIKGDGGEGKTLLVNSFARPLKKITVSLGDLSKTNNFFSYSLMHKRLGLVGETDVANFLEDSLVKEITGDNTIRIEPKGEQSFDYKPGIKLLITTNIEPTVKRMKASMRRVIYSTVTPPANALRGVEYQRFLDKWDKQFPAFFSKCVNLYQEYCEFNEPIPTEDSILDDLIAESESLYEYILNKEFRQSRGGHVVVSAVGQMLADKYKITSNKKKSEFYKYLDVLGYKVTKFNGKRRISGVEFIDYAAYRKREMDRK